MEPKVEEFKVTVDEKAYMGHKHGTGTVPLIVVGPADLFSKQGIDSQLPYSALGNTCTVYYVDLWKGEVDVDSKVSWESVTSEIEQVRKQLVAQGEFSDTQKIAVLGHSAAGGMALKYAEHYPQQCGLAIPVCFNPDWRDKESAEEIDLFVTGNAAGNRVAAIEHSRKAETDLFRSEGFNPDTFAQSFLENIPIYWQGGQLKRLVASDSSIKEEYVASQQVEQNPILDEKELPNTPAHRQTDRMWEKYTANTKKIGAYRKSCLTGSNFLSGFSSEVPVLFLMGIADFSNPCYVTADNLDGSDKPNANYHIFESAGHYPMFECPKAFSSVLEKAVQKRFSSSM